MNRLRGLTRGRLCRDLGIGPAALQHLAYSAPKSYREETRGDDTKKRRLLVPNRSLKEFQRQFYRRYLRDFSYHDAAYCVAGRGSIEAARVHRKHPYLLHLDITEFFPSVDYRRVRDAFRHVGVSSDFVKTLTRLVTVRNELPQGAPTSVAVGNLVLFSLDGRLQGQCDARGAGFAYTRYVDDIAISGGSRLEKFVGSVRRIVVDCGWKLNEKGGLLGPWQEHRLLGLRVGVEVSVDQQFLADVEACLDGIAEGTIQLDRRALSRVRGQIGWVKAVEPRVGQQLEARLDDAMSQIPASA